MRPLTDIALHKDRNRLQLRSLLTLCREVCLPKYLPWTDPDMGNIERALTRYRTLGLEASFDAQRAYEGVVTLSQVDLQRMMRLGLRGLS